MWSCPRHSTRVVVPMSGYLTKEDEARLSRITRERTDRACSEFQAGNLVDMSLNFPGGLLSIHLLLSSPHVNGVDAVVWDEDLADEPFMTVIPCDALGNYGRLLWRA